MHQMKLSPRRLVEYMSGRGLLPRKHVSWGKSEGFLGLNSQVSWRLLRERGPAQLQVRTMLSAQHTAGACVLGNSS